MVGRNLLSFGLVALSLVVVLALFGAVIFPMFFNYLQGLHNWTDSKRHAWQAVFWLLYAGMLATAGAVPLLVGKLREVSNETLVGSLIGVVFLVAIVSLPFLLFVGSCDNLFSAFSC